MNKWARNLPEGMRDYLFKDAARRRTIEKMITDVFKYRGYNEVITPVLEFFDVFSDPGNFIASEDMYKLFDSKGRILTLRHDMTTPIARVAATKLKDASLPLKLFYNQSVFRSNEYLAGKRDEISQCGVEVIGLNNDKSDLEVVVTAIEALKAIGDNGFKIELGNIGFFKAVAECFIDDNETIENIRHCIEMKNFAALDSILDSMDANNPGVDALRKLPRMFGDSGVISLARDMAPNQTAIAAIDHLEKICNDLKALGYGEYIAVDLGLVHHIGYYTGLVFRGYIDGSAGNCLAGGRYDTLSEKFGAKLPATGFAISVDSILDTMSRTNASPETFLKMDAVIHYEQGCADGAEKFQKALTDEGLRAEISLHDDIESTMHYASIRGASFVYLITADGIEMIEVKEESI